MKQLAILFAVLMFSTVPGVADAEVIVDGRFTWKKRALGHLHHFAGPSIDHKQLNPVRQYIAPGC